MALARRRQSTADRSLETTDTTKLARQWPEMWAQQVPARNKFPDVDDTVSFGRRPLGDPGISLDKFPPQTCYSEQFSLGRSLPLFGKAGTPPFCRQNSKYSSPKSTLRSCSTDFTHCTIFLCNWLFVFMSIIGQFLLFKSFFGGAICPCCLRF